MNSDLKSVHKLLLVSLLASLAVSGSAADAKTWPDYRGPLGNGHVSAPGDKQPVGLPLHWSETKNVTWKIPISHVGLSSPVVVDGQVWLTTATEEGHDFFVICVEAASGKVLLNKRLFHSDDPESLGNGRGVNSYATPSAVTEPGRAYVHFGRFGTACLDTATFKVLWQREDIQCRHYRGPASSPVLFENLLILTMDGVDAQYHMALDKRTGKTVWKTDRSVEWKDQDIDIPMVRDGDRRKAHSTPLIVPIDGKPQMFSVGAMAAYAYEPRSGQELWMIEFSDWSAAPRPVYHNGRVLFTTGFSRAEMLAVKIGGKGNVTDSHVDWKIRTRVPRYSSPIIVDGLLYMSADESFVSCLDANNGKQIWTERIDGKYRASPIYGDGRLYFFSLDGSTTVIKPGRNFEVLAKNKLTDPTVGNDRKRGPGFMASPAVAGNAFILRTRYHLYRVEE